MNERLNTFTAINTIYNSKKHKFIFDTSISTIHFRSTNRSYVHFYENVLELVCMLYEPLFEVKPCFTATSLC